MIPESATEWTPTSCSRHEASNKAGDGSQEILEAVVGCEAGEDVELIPDIGHAVKLYMSPSRLSLDDSIDFDSMLSGSKSHRAFCGFRTKTEMQRMFAIERALQFTSPFAQSSSVSMSVCLVSPSLGR